VGLLLKPSLLQALSVARDSEVDFDVHGRELVVHAIEEAHHNAVEEAFRNVLAHPEELQGVQFERRHELPYDPPATSE